MGEDNDPVIPINPKGDPITDPINPPGDPGWISAVNKELVEKHGEDMRQHANINPILEDYYSLKAKDADAIFKPKEGATPEEVAQYKERMDIPANVSGYELDAPAPELQDADFDKWFRDVSLETNQSKDQAKGMYNAWIGIRKEAADALKAETAKAEVDARASLGAGYDAAVANVGKIIEVGGPELKAWLNETGAGNHPGFLKVFTKLGSMISEDALGNTPNTHGSTEKSAAEVLYPNQGK